MGQPVRCRFLGSALAAVAILAFGSSVTCAQEAGSAAGGHPLEAALKLARESLAATESIKDFEATYTKREFVKKKLLSSVMLIKFREEPFSVYLRFFGESDGREAIYVEGLNDGKMLAHEVGLKALVGTVALLPTDPLAMAHSRRPITSIGLKNQISGVVKRWESQLTVPDIKVQYYPDAKLGDAQCVVIEATYTQPLENVHFQRQRVFIDKATKLAVRVENYAFPTKAGEKPPLVEEYTYSDIKLNVGLTDKDFDPKNPAYAF